MERENRKLKAALLSKQAMLWAAQSQQQQKTTTEAAIVQLMHAVLTMTMFVVAYVVIGIMCAQLTVCIQQARFATFWCALSHVHETGGMTPGSSRCLLDHMYIYVRIVAEEPPRQLPLCVKLMYRQSDSCMSVLVWYGAFVVRK